MVREHARVRPVMLEVPHVLFSGGHDKFVGGLGRVSFQCEMATDRVHSMKCGRKLDLYVESTTRIYGPANVAVTRRVSGTPVVREAHSAEPQRTFPSCKSKLLYQTADSLSVSRQLLAFLTERIIRSYQQHHIPRGLFFLPRLLYNLNMDKKAPKTAIHPNPFFHKRPPEEQPKTALGFFLHLLRPPHHLFPQPHPTLSNTPKQAVARGAFVCRPSGSIRPSCW